MIIIPFIRDSTIARCIKNSLIDVTVTIVPTPVVIFIILVSFLVSLCFSVTVRKETTGKAIDPQKKKKKEYNFFFQSPTEPYKIPH